MSEPVTTNTRIVPINFGPLKGANANARMKGPCGDTMEFWLIVENNKILMASYTTDGCVHSMICGSAGAAMITGASIDIAMKLEQQDVLAAARNIPEETAHCALLAINTIRAAIDDYRAKEIPMTG